MTRSDLLRDLERLILARVPKEHRRDVRTAQRAMTQIWTAAILDSEQHAYTEGASAERERPTVGEQRGFELGYQHGLDRAMGAVGAPARRLDEDDLFIPAS